MDKLKKLMKEQAGVSAQEAVETLINGNISDFKAWAKKASKFNFLESVQLYSELTGESYLRSLEYIKKLVRSGVMANENKKCKCEGKCHCGLREEIKKYNISKPEVGGAIKGGKKQTIEDPIDEPATGYVGRRKMNTGKQHHITAYDDQWESVKKSKNIKLKNLFKKKKSKKVDEYVAQRFNERDKVIGVIPFSTRNEVFDGVIERKSGEQYFVKPDLQSLGKLDISIKNRLKDGIWLTANQLKKKSTLTMTGLNP